MRKNIILLLVFILIGCSDSFQITKSQSEKNPNIINYSSPEFRVISEYRTQKLYAYMQLSCFQNEKSKIFSMAIKYVVNEWPLFGKVRFNLDGVEKLVIPNRPPIRRTDGIEGPTETITIQLTPEEFRQLFEAMDGQIIVVGREKSFTIGINQELRKRLFQFYKATNS